MVVSSGSMVKTSGCSESVVITTSPKSASIACARATPAAAASQWAAWQRRPRCRAAGYWPGLTGPERESSASWHPPHSCCGSGQFLVNRAAAAAAADLKGDVVADSNPWPHEVPALERVDRLPSRPWNSCERTGQSQADGSAVRTGAGGTAGAGCLPRKSAARVRPGLASAECQLVSRTTTGSPPAAQSAQPPTAHGTAAARSCQHSPRRGHPAGSCQHGWASQQLEAGQLAQRCGPAER